MTYTFIPDDKFGVRDTLPEDHDDKKILGVDFDEEFNKISTAIETINIDIADLIYNSGFPEPPVSSVDDPILYGRSYYDPDPDDDDVRATGTWIQTASKEEIDQIAQDIVDINVDIGDLQGGGAFPEAPKDGNQYARQDAGWSMVVTYDGTTVEGDLATEIQARIDGDAALQASIDSIEDYDDTGIKADLATETQARIDGDAALQSQIDGIPGAVPAPVDSVNGKTGVVVLSAADVGALPNSYDPGINYPVTSVNGKTGNVTLNYSDVGAKPSSYKAPVDSVNGKTGAVTLTHTDVGAKPNSYKAPVDSVNGKTGAVSLNAADVGALPSSYTPPAAPVSSVNGKTGAVTLSHTDVGAQVAGSYAAASHSHAYSSLTGKPTLYTGADAVKTSGNQTIAGTKTFNEDIRGKKNVVAYYSDVRLKDIQGSIENPIEKVKAIETFYYTHGDRARELGYEGSEIQVGVSAQSVQAVAPELIHRAPVDDDGEGGSVTGESYITVDYPRLVPLLIESIKQLSAELEELKK